MKLSNIYNRNIYKDKLKEIYNKEKYKDKNITYQTMNNSLANILTKLKNKSIDLKNLLILKNNRDV